MAATQQLSADDDDEGMVVVEAVSARKKMHGIKRQASQHLIRREFVKTAEICESALQELKTTRPLFNGNNHSKETELDKKETLNGFHNDDGHSTEVTDFMVLITQAFAELERWQEVLPFVTNFYHGIENCPKNVLKLCLLLHAKVREYSTCAAIYSIWMRTNEKLCSQEDLRSLIDLYVHQVLIPNQKMSEIAQFVGDSKLDDDTQQNIIQKYSGLLALRAGRAQMEQEADSNHNSNTFERMQNPQGVMDELVQKLIHSIHVFLSWCRTFKFRDHKRVLVGLGLILVVIMGVWSKLDLSSSANILYIPEMLKYFLFWGRQTSIEGSL